MDMIARGAFRRSFDGRPSANSAATKYGLSQIFLAMDATRIAGQDYLAAAINEVVDNVHGSARVDADRPVLYPGERSMGYRKDNLANGIPVSDDVWAKIKSL